MHSQISSGVNRIQRRRRGRNIVPRLAQGFGRLPSSAHPAVASSSRPVPGELVQFLVKIFFQISVPTRYPWPKFGVVPAIVRKSLQKFSRARRNIQMPRNEHLTSLEVSQQSVCVGTAYKILACDRDSYIPFIPDSQRVTWVGTLRAIAIGASWHGASEQTIREV